MSSPSLLFRALATLAAVGCSPSSTTETPASAPGGAPSSVGCSTDAECSSAASPRCEVETKTCVALAPGHELGYREGAPVAVSFTEVYAMPAAARPVDLTFVGETADEVFIVGYGDNALYRGTGLSTDDPTFKRILDPAASHFMLKPPAIAAGAPGFFATCGDNLNERGGGDGDSAFFMGPALFDTDPAILGARTAGGLGSHVDMLHNTPLCRGIAHESGATYWVFNSLDRSLDKYNFNDPHEPGGDDHSDGEIYRYAMGQVKGTDDRASHVFYDAEDQFLYVADTGNGRVVRLDTKKGTKGESLERRNEPLKDQGVMSGTQVEVVVPPGTLTQPSGIEVRGGLIYVTDAATSTFHLFDKSGKELHAVPTELAPGSLAGFAFGPFGKIYFTDKLGSKVYRIDTP